MATDKLSQLLDVILDDLSARFIINLPEEELSSVTRICFGLEQAHWFYEDFFRPLYPQLPSVNLRVFVAAFFAHCPLLWKFSGEHEAAFADFLTYKTRVPVRGAILLNKEMDKCVLVKGWKASAGWGFPKGKIDQEEDDADCAIREVKEECGFDISPYLKASDYVDRIMKEQRIRLYVVTGIPTETVFEPQTRKEISKIDWFALDNLPTYKNGDLTNEQAKSQKNNKFYMVAPFIAPLRKWIKRNRRTSKKDKQPGESSRIVTPVPFLKDQISAPADLESSSQALKLLLGVTNEPASMSEPSAVAEAPTQPQATTIDLATLFSASAKLQEAQQAPATSLPQSQFPRTSQSSSRPKENLGQIPQSLLQSLLGPKMNPNAFPQSNPHAELQQRSQAIPEFVVPATAQRQHQSIDHHIPNLSHKLPPGLYDSRVDWSPAQLKKSNPNAGSLLALLQPRASPPASLCSIDARPSSSVYNSQPPPMAPPMPYGNSSGSHLPQGPSPLAHKQSLLSLLKPKTESLNEAPPPSSLPPTKNVNDAFFLQYLIEATKSSSTGHS